MSKGPIFLGWDPASGESSTALIEATTGINETVTLSPKKIDAIIAVIAAWKPTPRPIYRYGDIIMFPATGEHAMVVYDSPRDNWVNTISLDGSMSGYKPGQPMTIARGALLDKWEIVG